MSEIFFLLLVVLLILSVPFLIAYAIDSAIKKSALNNRFRLFSLTPIFLFLYFAFKGVFPGNSFYEGEFVDVTGIEFPSNATIKYKSASYPGFTGDYDSVSLIEVEESFFNELPKILTNHGLQIHANYGSVRLDKAEEKALPLTITEDYHYRDESGVSRYVAFLSDGKTIIVYLSVT